MSPLGTLTFRAGEVAFVVRPPRLPRAPRERRGESAVARMLRAGARWLAESTLRSPIHSIPPLRRYPY